MKDPMNNGEGTPYPEFLRNLPEVDMPFKGIKAWLVQSDKTQVVFFDIEAVGEVPPHAHCAQWGMVIEGAMKLTIGGNTQIYKKGDWYYIPEGTEHSATFLSRVQVIDVFDDPNRYHPK